MINCAHPTHFHAAIGARPWHGGHGLAKRLPQSHAELDEATELDPGDPGELAALYAASGPSSPSSRS